MVELSVTGATKLALVAERLREAGARGLQRQMRKALRDAAKPLIAAARASARETLPRRGGLAAEIARSKFKVTVSTGASSARVRIETASHDPRIDTGRLRHPVYGNRDVWAAQAVRPGWMTRAMTEKAPVVAREMLAALDRIAAQIEGG
jgi:hypothetical protein